MGTVLLRNETKWSRNQMSFPNCMSVKTNNPDNKYNNYSNSYF